MKETEEPLIQQNLPERITDKMLSSLEVVGNRKIFFRASKYLISIAPKLGVTYDDILIVFELKKENIPPELEKKIEEYLEAPEDEKGTFDKDLKKINKILKEREERTEKFSKIPLKLAKFWFEECMKEEKALQEVFEIISEATGCNIEIIDNTDLAICSELFLRIFFKPKQSLSNTLFLNLIFQILKAVFPRLAYIIEELEDSLKKPSELQ